MVVISDFALTFDRCTDNMMVSTIAIVILLHHKVMRLKSVFIETKLTQSKAQ